MLRVPKSTERVFGKRLEFIFQKLLYRIRNSDVPVEKAIREFGFSKKLERYIETVMRKMINEQRVNSGKSWLALAKKKTEFRKEIANSVKREMSGAVGRRVAEMIQENATYIKTLPEQWADYASALAYRMTTNGKSPAQIEAELREVVPEHMQKNLRTIARTESAKANAAIAQARAEDMGIPCYIWRTCKDERVRLSHRRMEGVVCFWNDPPSPEGQGFYHPGNIYNCRCYAEPVLDSRDLPNGVKIYRNGEVRTLTKKSVMRIIRQRRG